MTDFSWLIEAPGPHYLGTRKVGRHEFFWTANPNQATRFISAPQADGVMMAVRALNPDMFAFAVSLRDAQPVEHGWAPDDGAVQWPLVARKAERNHPSSATPPD